MRIKIKIDKQLCVELLIILLVINYMIVTIIFNDFIVLKYLRDIILFYLIVIVSSRITLKKHSFLEIMIFLFFIFSIYGAINAVSMTLGITVFRKYFFPLLLLFILTNLDIKNSISRFLKFIIRFISIIAFWGIIQAQILGDGFLRKLGYPLIYSFAYGKDMLYNSYYFGGFGIQRVVSTLSNSNVCALVLGTSILFIFICSPYLSKIKYKNFLIFLIGMGYLLTFSRSNFLAMIIIVLFIAWPYIPRKKNILFWGVIVAMTIVIIGISQGTNGIIYKLMLWVQSSVNFTESSANSRTGKWLDALDAVIHNPLGIGFGNVGSIATEAGSLSNYYDCENSYLSIALDVGWGGLICYISFLILLFGKLKRGYNQFSIKNMKLEERLCKAAAAILLYLIIVMFFSNHIYDMEIMALVYIYTGIAFSTMKEIKNVNELL